ncbi:MAG TPA: glycoside hydrolase family 25 protein [Methylobacter sp.]|jgi:lysozyme
MSSSASIQGIDVSHYQGSVNWADVESSGIVFAFAKATEGITVVDAEFDTNWAGINAAGIIRGAYHFYISTDDPEAQAENFLKAVGSLAPGDLPPVLDIENYAGACGTASLAENVQTWLDAVQEGLQRRPMIYTGPSFWDKYMTSQFGTYPLWVAEYGVSQPRLPIGWTAWTIWQSTPSGVAQGVAGNVDLNTFAGSYAELQALLQT